MSSSANSSKRALPTSPAVTLRSVRPRGAAAADGTRGLPRQHNINEDGYFSTNTVTGRMFPCAWLTTE
eukprot:2034526-Amphidinium_carterae.1